VPVVRQLCAVVVDPGKQCPVLMILGPNIPQPHQGIHPADVKTGAFNRFRPQVAGVVVGAVKVVIAWGG
jgi:hypothetical protein